MWFFCNTKLLLCDRNFNIRQGITVTQTSLFVIESWRLEAKYFQKNKNLKAGALSYKKERTMSKKTLFLFFLMLSINISIFCDTVFGVVLDEATEKSVSAASIKLPEKELITYSDENGEFFFKEIEPGNYLISIKRIGYERKDIQIKTSEKTIIKLKLQPKMIEGIFVTETRAKERETPVTFTTVSQKEIRENYSVQDIPLLMSDIPNVYSYADAGSGLGYSYLKIRGFDQKRIGVMINGIPLNDPEDHQVYWVDMPDFAESLTDIQFQRGIGSSLYGVSTFGGSLNMQTSDLSSPDKIEVFSNYGTYKTIKFGVKTFYNFSNNWKSQLRLSRISSDNYRDNSETKLWAYFINLSRTGNKSATELNIYGGNELTHAAWYASYQGDLEQNHQHNPITYPNEIDDFDQPHLELHHYQNFNDFLSMKNSLFYIHGKGYYEQYKTGRDLWEYGLADVPDSLESDLIRQKWVSKNQYGWIGQMNFLHPKGELNIGSYLSLFDSEHWGEIKELINVPNIEFIPGMRYHEYAGNKTYLTFYANENLKIFQNLNLMLNLYYQKINYKFEQHEVGNFSGAFLNSYEVNYDFFNPRFGVNLNLNDNINIYGNISFAKREPTDGELYDTWDGPDDLGVAPLFAHVDTVYNSNNEIDHIEWTDPYVKEEKLTDYEFGIGYQTSIMNIQTNLFWMEFEDEIIAYGGVDDEGEPIRGNADETVHRGVELSLKTQLPANLELSGSFSYNDNYFKKFEMYDWDENWEVIGIDFAGKKIAGFPDILTNAKLSYKYKPVTVATQIQHVGKQYLDNTENEDRIVDPYTIANAYVILKLNEFGNIEISFRVNNIFDKKYETSGYYDPWGGPDWSGANYYFPGSERNFMLGVRMGI